LGNEPFFCIVPGMVGVVRGGGFFPVDTCDATQLLVIHIHLLSCRLEPRELPVLISKRCLALTFARSNACIGPV
jgi:hypothetical protein